MCSSQERYSSDQKIKKRKQVNPKVADFFMYVYQKSVNSGQIIPVFTHVWDDKPKSKRKKTEMAYAPERLSGCPCAFPNLARFHAEATTTDDGSDIGIQFDIASSPD